MDSKVTFSDGFKILIDYANTPIFRPEVSFWGISGGGFFPELVKTPALASASYTVDQTIVSNLSGHQVSVKRLPDTGWINFDVTLVEEAVAPVKTGVSENQFGDRHWYLKSVNLCIDSKATFQPEVQWDPHNDNFSGEGKLANGQRFCTEAFAPVAGIGFPDGYVSYITGDNGPFFYPLLHFSSQLTGDYETSHSFSLSDSPYEVSVGSHHFSVTRLPDTDLINFLVTVID